MYRGRRLFRYGRAIILLSVASTVLFGALAFWTVRTHGWTWLSVGALGLTILGAAGIAEGLVTRIELTDDALVVTSLRGRRRYALTVIRRVEESRGVPPAVLLEDGRWVRLPAVGTSIGNSIRAWLEQRPTEDTGHRTHQGETP
jgi:hypothetical protein